MNKVGMYLSLFVMLACLFCAATITPLPISHGGPVPTCRINDAACIANLMADGTDPMPLCRRGVDPNCKFPPAHEVKSPVVADGGPIPLCSPKDANCLRCWPFGCFAEPRIALR